ncbi:protein VACUOLELESS GAMETOPHYTES-like [Cornus florida]|uniref:protein VACUOLELESS GAMETOPHYTES-like n=1 Tax=Cornus florida TaxID=4283 RepID=UPI0028A2A335|nr:protein VACUOLELESS GAMETOPHYTES-like [Cornus florida]
MASSIEHFTHPGHGLVKLHAETDYLCDGCNTPGVGTRYHCNSCDFDLHDYCGTCPQTLTSFMHSHPLTQVLRKPQATRHTHRVCDVCGDELQKLFYRCKDCDFDVHPLCTQLPQYMQHASDPLHPLSLQTPSSLVRTWCFVCGGSCTSWRYRCGVCGIDIHFNCVLTPCHPPTLTGCGVQPGQPPPYNGYGYGVQPGGPPPTQPPPYGGYGYGVASAYCNNSPYTNMYNYANANPPQGEGGGASTTTNGRKMASLVGKLALGVVQNVIFGTGNVDFSSFM